MTTINDHSDNMTLAAITTRLVSFAMIDQQRDPRQDVAEHLAAALDTVIAQAHAITAGRPVAGLAGPLADAAAQLHALARRRKAHYPAQTVADHLAGYLDRLTMIAIEAADAADLHAASMADRIH